MALITPITGFVTNPMTEDLECNAQVLNDIQTYKTAVLLTNGLDTIAGSTEIDIDDNLIIAPTKSVDFTGVGEIERGLSGNIRFPNLPTTGIPAITILSYNTVTGEVESTTPQSPTNWSLFPAISDATIQLINNLRNITNATIQYICGPSDFIMEGGRFSINAATSKLAINEVDLHTIRLQADNLVFNGKITGVNQPFTGAFLTADGTSQFQWSDASTINVGFAVNFNNMANVVQDELPYNVIDNTTAFLPPPIKDYQFLRFNQDVTPNRTEWTFPSITQFRASKMFPQNVLENPFPTLNVGPGLIPSTWTYFESAVNHPNGYVYFIPYDPPRITRLNPETGVSDTYAGFNDATSQKYVCGITATDMKIYCPPFGAMDWLIFDPYTNTHTLIPVGTNGRVCVTQIDNILYTLATDGVSSSEIYEFNITTNAEILVASLSGSWWGCSIGVDGKIYYAPYQSTDILVLDPATNTTATIATGLTAGPAMYKSVGMAKNGNLYFAPYNETQIMILNTRTSTVSFLGTFSGTNLYSGITASTNDRLYLCPYGADNVPIVDPGAGTVDITTITGLNATFGTEKWSQLLLLQNATQLVLVPDRVGAPFFTSAQTRSIKTGLPEIPAWMLSQNLNKD